MPTPVQTAGNYKNMTATGTVFTGPCALLGIMVSSASGTPTIKISDGANTVANTFTPTGATFYPVAVRLNTSLVVTIGGTVDCCVIWGV
jgi:hypothetical protein